MGSGKAKSVRLDLGIDLRNRVHSHNGTDKDIILIQNEAPGFMDQIASQIVERANLIRGDRECFRLMHDDVVIEIPALKRPTLEQIKKSWNYIEKIERDDSTEEPVTLRLATVLRSSESFIDGGTYELRLTVHRDQGRLLGFQHRQYLLDVQQQHPALMALLGNVYIDFPGIIVERRGGRRCVPVVNFDGKRFVDGWGWVGSVFDGNGRVAVSVK